MRPDGGRAAYLHRGPRQCQREPGDAGQEDSGGCAFGTKQAAGFAVINMGGSGGCAFGAKQAAGFAVINMGGPAPDTPEDPAAHGAPGGTRTPDPRLRRPPLYPAELRAQALHVGVSEGARTLNTRIHSPVLCQLSYTHRKSTAPGGIRSVGCAWRARRDSNPRPAASKADALS